MKRLLGALGFVGATLFVVSSANAAVVGSFDLSPGAESYSDGSNSSVGNLPHVWTMTLGNVTPFIGSVSLFLDFSTQANNFSSFSGKLCTTGVDSSGNCTGTTYGPIGGLVSGTTLGNAGLLTTSLTNGTYYLVFDGVEKPGATSWSYSFTASTPIPAAALLFASGLGFIGFAGRKRKGQLAVASDEVSGTRA